MDSNRPDKLTLAAFWGAVLIGGMNFVAVRFSNRELAPLFGAAVRFATAGVMLFGWMALRRVPFPRGKALFGTVVYGLLMFATTYALMYWALLSLHAGVAAVLFSFTPLVTLVLAALHGVDRFHVRGLVGGLLTVVGIGILAYAPSEQDVPILPLLAMAAAAVAASEAGVIIKKFPPNHPVATNAIGISISAPVLFLASAGLGETWVVPTQPATYGAVIYLAALGSVGLFGLYLFALKRWTVTAMSYFPVLMPVVTIIAGSIIAKEPIVLSTIFGALFVLGGVYVGALSKPKA